MYRCGVSIALLFHTHWTFLHTHPHTHYTTLSGPLGNPCWHAAWRLTCGLRVCVCNVAVEVPNEGGDDEENYWQFLISTCLFLIFFVSRFIFISYSQPSSTPDFYGLKGQKKYVYVYRNRVNLIFHDTNNPIIMTRLLFSNSYQVLFFLFFFSSLSNLSLSKKSACSTLDCLTSTKNSKKRKLARLRAKRK